MKVYALSSYFKNRNLYAVKLQNYIIVEGQKFEITDGFGCALARVTALLIYI